MTDLDDSLVDWKANYERVSRHLQHAAARSDQLERALRTFCCHITWQDDVLIYLPRPGIGEALENLACVPAEPAAEEKP